LQWRGNVFEQGRGGRWQKIQNKSSFCPKIANHLYQPVISMRARSYTFPGRAWRFFGIYYQNNPFLGMFQLKFCLKSSKLVQKILGRGSFPLLLAPMKGCCHNYVAGEKSDFAEPSEHMVAPRRGAKNLSWEGLLRGSGG